MTRCDHRTVRRAAFLSSLVAWCLGVPTTFVPMAGCGGANDAEQAGEPADDGVPYPEYRAAMNVAAGLMNRFEFQEAEDAYRQIVAKWGGSRDARRNLAISILNQSEPGAQEEAIEMLDAFMDRESQRDGGKRPVDLSAHYSKGLCLLYLGRHREARDIFVACGNRAPNDPYAAYFAGQCLELDGRHEEALDWYERSIELDPYLRSPLLGAQRCLARLGRESEGTPLLERFLALADNPRGKLAEFKYTRMGSLGEVRVPTPVERPTLPPAGAIFADASPMPIEGLVPNAATHVRPATDLNADGVLDFTVVSRRDDAGPVESLALSASAEDGSFEWRLVPFDASPDAGLGSASLFWADLDNDGRTDVAASPGDGTSPFWWRQREGLRWSRESFGEAVDGTVRLLAAADVDHDGDVDLVATSASGSAFLMNRSDGDGTRATSWTLRRLENSMGSASSVTLGDFDDDGDLDLMLLSEGDPAQVWINELLWSWRRDARYRPIEAGRPAAAVWFRDDDTGGPRIAALIGARDERRLGIWSLEGTPVPVLEIADGDRGADGATSVAAIDVAGSGRVNLLLHLADGAAGGTLEIRDARGGRLETISDVSAGALLAVPDARGPVLLTGPNADGVPQWRDAGPGRMPFAAVWFSGRTDPSQQMRSNASGLGTRGDARTFDSWQSRTLLPWRSGASAQPLEPVLYGLGGAREIDWLFIEWPDGVLQSELDLESGIETFAEIQRQISSCPVIFAWNGRRFEFVTDALGVGGMGYLAAIEEGPNGELAPAYPTPRPLESVRLGGADALAPREGRYEIRLGEPMEEACYLDAARLVAWDLPPGWSMTLDERMGISGPAPTGEAAFFRRSMVPSEAVVVVGDGGPQDVLDAVIEVDHVAADPGPHHARFIGRTEDLWTLTFGFPRPIAGDGRGVPTLLMDGWVEYPYSSTSFAMWQADAIPEPPTLEALDPATGEWTILVEHYGYPAGMPRQASFPIPTDRLPADCVALRLRTSNEIYIDRLALAWLEPCPEARRIQAPLVAGSVADAGFAQRPSLPQRRPWYDYERRVPLWDVRFQEGFYTAFGDCTPLLAETDDAVAIFGGGEEIRLEFDSDVSEAPPDWTRTWVLELDGWCKDMDPYTGLGDTLEPLPLRAGSVSTPQREALHRRFNTRFAAGR